MPGVRVRVSLYLEDAQNRNRIISGNPGDRPVIAGVFLYHAEPEWSGRIYARIRGLLYRFLDCLWPEYYSRFRQEILWLRPEGVAVSSAQQLRKCVAACLIAAALLIAGIFVTGLKGSFWLVYWLIAVAFTPLMWWGVGKWYERKASKES